MITSMTRVRHRNLWRPTFAFAVAICFIHSAYAAPDGAFTPAQAQAGAQIFSDHCAKCHGESLEGKDGPPLVGPDFASTLEYGHMTTPLLYTFISQAMPADNPASLTSADYLAVLSFILSKNGYKSGETQLAQGRLAQVQLLPLPTSSRQAGR